MTDKKPRRPAPKPEELTWWHTITLPDGTKTQGVHDYDTPIGDRYLFPDVAGKSVLDIGCFDGYWSARAVKNGAERVLAVDWLPRDTAKLVSKAFGFTYQAGQLAYDMNNAIGLPKHDVVLFYGVVYHLYNPIQGIINAINATAEGGTLLIESAVNQAGVTNGSHFLPTAWDGDDTNHWMPSMHGLLDAVRLALRLCGRAGHMEQKEENLRGTIRITNLVRI